MRSHDVTIKELGKRRVNMKLIEARLDTDEKSNYVFQTLGLQINF